MPFRALRSGMTTRAKARAAERLVPLPAVPTDPPRGAWLVRARRRRRRKKRRDPLEQCPDNHGNVRGGVTLGRSGACSREQSRGAFQEVESSPKRRLDGFRSGAKHLGLSETVALRGAAAEGDLGRVLAERGSLQPPRSNDAATRVLEGTFEEGSSPVKQANPSLECPRPTLAAEAKASGARAARFTETVKRA
jgi:hypothetical protein